MVQSPICNVPLSPALAPALDSRCLLCALYMAEASECSSEGSASTCCRCCSPQQPGAAHQPRTHAHCALSGRGSCSRPLMLTHLVQAVLGVLQFPAPNGGRSSRRRRRRRLAEGQVPWRWPPGSLLRQLHAGARRRRRPAVGRLPWGWPLGLLLQDLKSAACC